MTKNEKLLQAMENIDDDMILNAVSDTAYKKKKPSWGKWIAIAATFALVLGGIATGINFNQSQKVSATIALDVNPSMEIEVNKDEKVLRITPFNEDATIVIGEMDFENVDLDVAINALIGSMLKNGYLTTEQNSIMISVDSDNPETELLLQTELSNSVTSMLQGSNIGASVVTQAYNKTDTITHHAEAHHISPAKASLITKIESMGLTDATGTAYTSEELAALSVNQLKLILESRDMTVEGITCTGVASDASYIGKDTALSLAYTHAGITPDSATKVRCYMDCENHIMVYEIDFFVGTKEYEYEIHATTGDILHYEIDVEDDIYDMDDIYDDDIYDNDHEDIYDDDDYNYGNDNYGNGNNHHNEHHGQNTQTPNQNAGNQGTGNQGQGNQNAGTQTPSHIGKDAALSIAYSHAGISPSAASNIEFERDVENGITVYEISFYAGGYEYDYEINASTGAILDYEKEVED